MCESATTCYKDYILYHGYYDYYCFTKSSILPHYADILYILEQIFAENVTVKLIDYFYFYSLRETIREK